MVSVHSLMVMVMAMLVLTTGIQPRRLLPDLRAVGHRASDTDQLADLTHVTVIWRNVYIVYDHALFLANLL